MNAKIYGEQNNKISKKDRIKNSAGPYQSPKQKKKSERKR